MGKDSGLAGKNLWNLFPPFYPGKGEKGGKTMFFPLFPRVFPPFFPQRGEKGEKPNFGIFKQEEL